MRIVRLRSAPAAASRAPTWQHANENCCRLAGSTLLEAAPARRHACGPTKGVNHAWDISLRRRNGCLTRSKTSAHGAGGSNANWQHNLLFWKGKNKRGAGTSPAPLQLSLLATGAARLLRCRLFRRRGLAGRLPFRCLSLCCCHSVPPSGWLAVNSL
jgi:hypothetical protein